MHSSPSPLMHFATLAVLLHVTWLPFGADSASVGINTDKEALMSFKSQISQESPSSPLSYWNPSSSPCTWPGVICNNFGNRVIGLNLSSFGLEGTISPHIGNLSFLRSIQLQNNKLSGNLPREIGNLFRLRVLNISFKTYKITGSVTDEQLRNLRSLQVLNLGKNLLWRSIPPSIANLSSLNTLNLGTNNLTGSILSDLSRLENLKVLDLTINRLTGTVPSTIYNMTSLVHLRLASNQLGGEIPYDVGDTLPNLLDFIYCFNRFTGKIPGSLHNLTNIQIIRMTHNLLEGTVPPGDDEGLSFTTSLTNSTHLNYLALDGNQFEGKIPESIGNFSNVLSKLYLGGNHIYGKIPASIGRLRSLTLLDLSYNSISGEIPIEIGQLQGLQVLGLAGNEIPGGIPNSLANLKKLNQIDLSGNELTGEIPISFGNFQSLLSIDLSNNRINGNIPKGILRPIPNIVAELKGLEVLDLSSNKLSGSIPSDLQNLQALRSLNLTFNNLEGVVPSEGIFRNMSNVHLKGNPKLCLQLGECTSVAVKVLHNERTGSWKSFIAECETLRNVRHRNLVKLITSCSSLDSKNMEFLALVYEFLSNGSLGDWIHGERKNELGNGLNFLERLNVAIDIASALDYLHNDCEVPIVHSDLKPGNILLDEEMTAKVGDFGLARFLLERVDNQSSISSTHVFMGSIGYVPPENVLQVLDPELRQLMTSNESQTIQLHDCLITIIGSVGLSCTTESPGGRIGIREALCRLKSSQEILLKQQVPNGKTKS
ncbi:hypothetical protein WN944_009760 [Citrus x changshan-huyou]|uniref:Protein kinase domain-containing protein n=1 Tax=Citrus x changshan-huyou TaxID=2935761 RepID=A0AAP0MSB3_9ROSI